MKNRAVAAALLSFVGVSQLATAQFYGKENSSPISSAVPGEFFFYKGVEAVKSNDYQHAVRMYKVAASWAYKQAEYNLGVIFAKGEGDVPLDMPQAHAWMTLAAERNDQAAASAVEARDRIAVLLSPEQREESSRMLAEMKKIYGDDVALPRAKTRWREVRNSATGSHVGFIGNLQVGDLRIRNNANPMNAKNPKGAGALGSVADITGGSSVDGSTAYRELRSTDNPYDPKFDGRVTVGDISTVQQEGTTPGKSAAKEPNDD